MRHFERTASTAFTLENYQIANDRLNSYRWMVVDTIMELVHMPLIESLFRCCCCPTAWVSTFELAVYGGRGPSSRRDDFGEACGKVLVQKAVVI
jgi:hypothetical protein